MLDIGERKKLQFAHEADESAEEQLDRRSFVGPQTSLDLCEVQHGCCEGVINDSGWRPLRLERAGIPLVATGLFWE